ncbi:uncharacterized protein LOC121180250 [Toxotes jaculatrix]|uniref:uncharacterized protein LOC121180250 n=1 Tax=Toxotes jaculatrix TaxID=941984 RepID=UPI001B3AE9BD|nr:uncharacterized protein LOC121180250 [Toxotes jaculatrix]
MWRAMMGVVYVVVAMFSLLSVGQSAPVTSCESLIQPLQIQGRDQLLGKWTYLAESTDITGSKLLTKMFVESVWGKFTAANESDAMNLYQSQKMFGRCFSVTFKLTLKDNTIYMEQPYNASATLLNTGCSDCLVFYSKYNTGSGTYSGLQFLSRRNKVSDAELQEFVKQAQCLNLPSPAILDPEKGLCPDESSTQDTETVDLTSVMTDINMDEVFNIFDKIMNSQSGMKTLLKLITSDITGFKQT